MQLQEIGVGAVQVNNVDATIIESSEAVPVLLGMAFLRRVNVDIRDDTLKISSKPADPYLAQN